MIKDSKSVFQMPFLEEILDELHSLHQELSAIKDKVYPIQEWYDLKGACKLKGINYNTVSNENHRKHQPNQGIPDKIICGRKRWTFETIKKWVQLGDDEIDRKIA